MLNERLLEAAAGLKLRGFAEALRLQLHDPASDDRGFSERLMALFDSELTERGRERRTRLTKRSGMPIETRVADIRWDLPRGLKRDRVEALATCDWVAEHHNLVITGPTRVGKSFVARALASEAAGLGFKVLYKNMPDLLEELAEARVLRRLPWLRRQLRGCDLLVLDMWAIQPLEAGQACELLTLLDAREGKRATAVVSAKPVDAWLDALGDPTTAEAIVERVLNCAHRIELKGDAVRSRPSVSSKKG